MHVNKLRMWFRQTCLFVAAACLLVPSLALASMGLAEMPATKDHGPVTVFYPSTGAAAPVERGAFRLDFAWQGDVVRGNGRLVVISHGSSASPWVYVDLARTLVDAGFTVAMPEHFADNDKDGSAPGPESWKRRPMEVSHAIDAIGQDTRFSRWLDLSRVGMYGMSAGGHTALTLAGGRWSPVRLKAHCEVHLTDDFQACVGLTAQLNGDLWDGWKIRLARWIISSKLTDANWYGHTDPRIAAVVAGVPFAADFDETSLSAPRVPLGIIVAGQDKWLIPAFHSERILRACKTCERLADIPSGGHGMLLSPLPPNLSGLIGDLINDPPGFDRAKVVPEVNQKITSFFQRHLTVPFTQKGSP